MSNLNIRQLLTLLISVAIVVAFVNQWAATF